MRFAVLVALPALQEHARRLADFSSLRKGVGRDYTPFQKSAVCGAITCTLSPSKNSRFPPPVAEVGLKSGDIPAAHPPRYKIADNFHRVDSFSKNGGDRRRPPAPVARFLF